jgi:NADH-quinone oxidoreductase subunit C
MTEVNHQILGDAIAEQFGNQVLSIEESYGSLDIVVEKSIIIALIDWLKKHETFKVNFLTSLCGTHFPNQKNRELSVVYHLHSLTNNLRFRIHVFLPASNPEIPTLTSLFAGANWMERETFEFFGIKFTGHPDLRIILNVEDMDYHPLLKQYPLVDATRTDKDDKYFGR